MQQKYMFQPVWASFTKLSCQKIVVSKSGFSLKIPMCQKNSGPVLGGEGSEIVHPKCYEAKGEDT